MTNYVTVGHVEVNDTHLVMVIDMPEGERPVRIALDPNSLLVSTREPRFKEAFDHIASKVGWHKTKPPRKKRKRKQQGS